MSEQISKKFGGQGRAQKAREAMSKIFSDPNHELFLEKDIELANRFNVSRLTIYNIREELKIPPRTDRILKKLKGIDTKQFTKKELADKLHMKYQNLYKIIQEYKIKVKPDVRPIVSMLKFQKEKIKNADTPVKKTDPVKKAGTSVKKAAPAKKAPRGAKKTKQVSQ